MDIVALLQCLQPTVTTTTLRQCSRIVLAHAGHDGTCHDVGPLPLGRPRGQLSDRAALFLHGASRGPRCFGCSFVSMCTVLRRSTCWWAMKSWPPKRANTPMAWIGSLPVCMASRCQGWPSSRCPWSAPSNGARSRSASSRSCAATQRKRPARPKRHAKKPGTLHRQAPSRASQRAARTHPKPT